MEKSEPMTLWHVPRLEAHLPSLLFPLGNTPSSNDLSINTVGIPQSWCTETWMTQQWPVSIKVYFYVPGDFVASNSVYVLLKGALWQVIDTAWVYKQHTTSETPQTHSEWAVHGSAVGNRNT